MTQPMNSKTFAFPGFCDGNLIALISRQMIKRSRSWKDGIAESQDDIISRNLRAMAAMGCLMDLDDFWTS